MTYDDVHYDNVSSFV